MKGICPNCEKETELELVHAKEVVDIRGEPIEVDALFSKCLECGESFESTRGPDALDAAYREYRRRHGMLQPEEIRERRRNYGLTQKELSQLLGWGGATLSRYENGALQQDAHEKLLRLGLDPHNLIKLIEETPQALTDSKRDRLIKELHDAEDEACSFEILFEGRFGRYEPDEYSGYKRFALSKLFNTILFFCKGGQPKTKLNKLLFYADFKHFKDYAVSISGARYVHLQYGPVPDNYEYFFADLVSEKDLEVQETFFGDFYGYWCASKTEPDLSIFENSELKILAEVKEYFKSFGSKAIMEFSHQEAAYTSTYDGEVISYLYADSLKI